MNQTVMNDNRTAGTTTGRQHASYHHATSPRATQHCEVTPRTASRRARPALLLASLICLMTLASCYDYQDQLYTERELAQQRAQGEVKLAMTFNDNKATRMTAEETQATDGTFLGVTQIYAIPFAPAQGVNNPVAGTDTRLDLSTIGLGPILSTDGNEQYVYKTDPNSSNVSLSRSKLYMSYPKLIGTTAYLAYAIGSGDSQTHGKIGGLNDETMSTVTQAQNFSFTPVSFYASATDEQKAKGQALADYLTSIANAEGWEDSEDKSLKDARETFCTMHAAASIDVAALVASLYSILADNTDDVSQAIKEAIEAKATIEEEGEGNDITYTATLDESLEEFPSKMGLPDGAAALNWENGEFVCSDTYLNVGFLQTSTGMLSITPLNSYVYPMPLIYRTNSPVVTSNADVSEVYRDNVPWKDITDYHTDGKCVLSTTQSVAIEKQLTYAVARLETRVKAEGTVLTDKQGNELSVTNTSSTPSKPSFPITGVLVGGQKKVNFEFHPDDEDPDYYVVYDATMPEDGFALTYAEDFNGLVPIHTLLLESEESPESDEEKQKVPIAIEFQNNSGQNFYGVNENIIPKGAKFYLAGYIDMSKEDFIGKRAFTQQYVSILNCTVKNLENAYNVIPDLRDTRLLKIGLTVEPWIFSTPLNINLY